MASVAYLYPLLQMEYASQREVQLLEQQLEELQERNAALREDVEELRTPEGVEQAARQALGYVKPGEDAYVVIDGEDATGSDGTDAVGITPIADDAPWWREVLDVIFGVDS